MSDLTHRLAAAAYVFRDGKVLLLKRANPPHTFAPPGGRLDVGEDPLAGALREVREETGLDVDIFGVAHTWSGSIVAGASPIVCINYLAQCASGEPRLSAEHTDFVWATRSMIESREVRTQDADGNGYRPESILHAFELFRKWA